MIKTFQQLKNEQRPIGTYDCYCASEGFPNQLAGTTTLTVFQWEQDPRSRSKTKVPRCRWIMKAIADRLSAKTQAKVIKTLVQLLNEGRQLELPKKVAGLDQWVALANHVGLAYQISTVPIPFMNALTVLCGQIANQQWSNLTQAQRNALSAIAYQVIEVDSDEHLQRFADDILDAIERADPTYQKHLQKALNEVVAFIDQKQ